MAKKEKENLKKALDVYIKEIKNFDNLTYNEFYKNTQSMINGLNGKSINNNTLITKEIAEELFQTLRKNYDFDLINFSSSRF